LPWSSPVVLPSRIPSVHLPCCYLPNSLPWQHTSPPEATLTAAPSSPMATAPSPSLARVVEFDCVAPPSQLHWPSIGQADAGPTATMHAKAW
jgi:hypothetical protein